MDAGISYFRLDCHLNDKISQIEAEFGLKGFGIIIRLWQKIYSEDGYYCEWGENGPLLFLAKWFAGGSGVDLNLIECVVRKALKLGIFDMGMYQEHAILTSERIQEHYLHVTKRRSNVNMKKEYLLVKCAQNGNNVNKNDEIVSKKDKNASQKAHSIVKDKKEKDIKYFSPEAELLGRTNENLSLVSPGSNVLPLPTKDGKDYTAKKEDIDEWTSLYPDIDIKWEFRRMKGWLLGKPERKKTYRGMKRFINSWLSNAQKDFYEKKKTGSAIKKNAFSNFDQRTYDIEKLERMLMDN